MLLALLLLLQGGQATNVRHGDLLPTKCTASAQIFILNAGQLYYCSATDTWTALASGGGSGTVTTTGSPANGNLAKFSGGSSITNGDLAGAVTTSGTLTTTLADNAVSSSKILNAAVTYDKIQAVSANSKLLGSGAAGSGSSPTELTLGTNLSMSGNTLNASPGGGSGTVTSVATTTPIGGGTITGTGTITCVTCVTSASALPSTYVLFGNGLQTATTDSALTFNPTSEYLSLNSTAVGVNGQGTLRHFTTFTATGNGDFYGIDSELTVTADGHQAAAHGMYLRSQSTEHDAYGANILAYPGSGAIQGYGASILVSGDGASTGDFTGVKVTAGGGDGTGFTNGVLVNQSGNGSNKYTGIYLGAASGTGSNVSQIQTEDSGGAQLRLGTGDIIFGALKTTGAATGKKVVCVDTTTGKLYASSTGVDCSN